MPDTTAATKPDLVLITLTTATGGSPPGQRMIVHGVLTHVREKGAP